MPGSDFEITAQPTLQQLTDYFVEKLFDPANLGKVENAFGNAAARGDLTALGAKLTATKSELGDLAAKVAGMAARLVLTVLNSGEPVYNELAKVATGTLLGDGLQHASVPADSGRRLIEKIAGGAPAT